MPKQCTTIRIDEKVKREAATVLKSRYGMSLSEGVNLFLEYVSLYGEMPKIEIDFSRRLEEARQANFE